MNAAPSFSYTSPSFAVQARPDNKGIYASMIVKQPWLTTATLPHTYEFLKANFPSVLKTRCFNDSNLPFDIEVQKTELAHLLEHLVLDIACQEKVKNGSTTATFRGETSWDWGKDPHGTFHITFTISKKEWSIFMLALNRAIELLEELLGISIPSVQPAWLPATHD